MKKTERILMYGYFGAGNMGDEAILEVQSKILKQLAPDIEISIFTRNIERAKELNLIPYKFDNIFEIFEAIESCDLIISGGGELFQDITGTSTPLYYGLMMFLGKIAKNLFLLLDKVSVLSQLKKEYHILNNCCNIVL